MKKPLLPAPDRPSAAEALKHMEDSLRRALGKAKFRKGNGAAASPSKRGNPQQFGKKQRLEKE